MPCIDLVVKSDIKWSPRARQVASIFDLEKKPSSESWKFEFELPEEWGIGLIVGPSGSGKTTVANELFGDCFEKMEWPEDKTVIDGFPAELGVKDVTGALSSVGFSSPPSWLRPFNVLSNGEKFRAELARLLVSDSPIVAVDEFTSVVDRTVAKVGSAAVSKAVRRSGRKLVAIGCHYDVIEWLQPDWVLHMPEGRLERRSVRQFPQIDLRIERVRASAWDLFSRHHYLDHGMNKGCKCFVAYWDDVPVAFCSVRSFPHPQTPAWQGSRLVVFPDYQGVGIGNRLLEEVGSAFKATGKIFRATMSHPAVMHHMGRSKKWHMYRKPGKLGLVKRGNHTASSFTRITAGFEYAAPANLELAKAWKLV